MLSFVIPAHDEEDNLSQLVSSIRLVCEGLEQEHEILLIDDGSRDKTWQVMTDLARHQPHVRAARLRRNFGKATALATGFSLAKGDVVFTMDADLQDDPREIPRFLARLDSGFDVVGGWRRQRYDPWHKLLPSRIFNWVVNTVTRMELNDHNCGFKAYRADVLPHIRLYGELHRYIPVLLAAKGFRIGEVEVVHHPRRHGVTKYGARRLMIGFLDLITVMAITAYRYRPLHLLGPPGLILSVSGAAGLSYLALLWFLGLGPIATRPLLFYSVAALMLGCQMLVLGVLAEFITAAQPDESQTYVVGDQVCGGTKSVKSVAQVI